MVYLLQKLKETIIDWLENQDKGKRQRLINCAIGFFGNVIGESLFPFSNLKMEQHGCWNSMNLPFDPPEVTQTINQQEMDKALLQKLRLGGNN